MECGLAFAHPQPSDAELAAIYSPSYYSPFGYDARRQHVYRQMKRAWFARLLAIAEGYVSPGRLLDVGSGLGDLLAVGRSRGWDVQGIEPNPFAIAQAEGALPGATIRGSLRELAEVAESFDLVTCCDVLEHVRDPRKELSAMQQALRPGGWLLVTTIDARGWQARLSGASWIHYLPEHLWYFDRTTLSRLVTAAGFEVVHWQVPRKIFNLRYVLGIFAHHSRNGIWRRIWRATLNCTPQLLQSALLPGLPEGQLLIARRPTGRSVSGLSAPVEGINVIGRFRSLS